MPAWRLVETSLELSVAVRHNSQRDARLVSRSIQAEKKPEHKIR